jgi:hypothetical protein
MRPYLTLVLALGTAAMHASAVRAQADTAAPRAVADSFFRLVADERFLDAARLMDLEAFDAHRRSTLEFARRPMERRQLTAKQLMAMDPKMPRAVAEYQAKRANEQVADMSLIYRREFGVSTLDSIATLGADQLAARALAARDMRTMMRESLRSRAGGCALSDAEQREILSRMHVHVPRIIGVVTADTIAYVLYDRFDVDIADSAADSAARQPESAVPAPTRFGRDWEVMPPGFLPLRLVGGAWRVGPAMDWGGTSFISGCGATGRRKRKG